MASDLMKLPLKGFAALVLFTAACSAATSPGTSSSQQVDATDGGACRYPASVAVETDASPSGCFAGPPGQICQVSNGATVNAATGQVTGGTESCHSMCGASQYELTCRSAGVMGAIPDPESSLDCNVIPL